ncbi:MAG: hypothetical protein CL808_06515 [Citromicrobium sp.]|nr:hypothetical protein [Citromicrobium sp.]
MSVGALGVTAFETPAYAQKRANYSDDFVKAFAPVDEAMKAENPDYEALLQQARAVEATVKTDDDRFAYSSTLYNIAQKLENTELQREAMEMMIGSGKVPEEALPQYTYIAGQLAYNLKDYPAARERIEEAIALGYDVPDAEEFIASTYAQEGDTAGGLQYVAAQVNDQVAAGEAPAEKLLKRGLTIAYNNDMYEDATNFSLLLAKYYPSATSWGDAIAIQRNYGQYSDAEMLDLLRLLRATNAMREARDYTDYIDAANFRRLPGEVGAVAQEGLSAGLLQSGDVFVDEAVSESKQRVAGLRADLPELESDAKASGASASLAVAAGDVYLNFEQPAKAAELYEVALTRPDVDRNTALTRLGIAQAKAGDYAAAQETFGQVQGNRAPIAKLWATYAEQQAGGGTAAS